MPFGRHQEDQEGQECPKTGVLEDFGCLGWDFVIVPLYMIHFWDPWELGNTQEDSGVLWKDFQKPLHMRCGRRPQVLHMGCGRRPQALRRS